MEVMPGSKVEIHYLLPSSLIDILVAGAAIY